MSDDAPEYGRLPLPPELSPRRRGRVPRSAATRPHRRHRWLTVIAGMMSFLVLAVSVGGWAYYEKLNGNIHRVKVFTFTAEKDRPAKAKDDAMNILLVGSDSRVGLTPAELAEANATGDGGGLNTDTIMLLHISASNAVTIISFPRDSYVPIPGHGTFKINSAYADGEHDKKGSGPALLTQTVENLTGVHIDHYMQVNFVQFIAISNVIGGVQVCLTKAQKEPDSGINLPAGLSTISGKQALAFVRQRHGLPRGDLDRIARQQRFITAMVKKVKTVRSPTSLNALLEKVTSSLTVDDGLSGRALIALANRLEGVNLDAIKFDTVPVSNIGASDVRNGQTISYVQLNKAALPAFFAPIANDADATTPPSGSTPTTASTPTPLDPREVSVKVLNGRGVTGAATKASAALRDYGYNVVSTGNAAKATDTTIHYPSSQLAQAQSLQKAAKGATLVQDDTVSSLTLILGTNGYTVTSPGSTTSTTPTPSTSSTTATTAANDNCGV